MPSEEVDEQKASDIWTWNKTVDSNAKIFTVFVDTNLIRLDITDPDTGDVITPGNMPKVDVAQMGGLPAQDASLLKDLAPEFNVPDVLINTLGVAQWKFIGESDFGNGRWAFHYFAPKTALQQTVPNKVSVSFGSHPWPLVLLAIWPEIDYSVLTTSNAVSGDGTKLGVNLSPTIRIRASYLPAVNEGTKFTKKVFLTAEQPIIKQWPVPQPMPVEIQVNGASREFPECLHDDLRFKRTPSGTASFFTGSTVANVGGVVSEQDFPRTGKFITRKPYVLDDAAEQNEYGLWQRSQDEVTPPPIVPATSN